MGRQKGQSQRTKGNVRPSSSGRAAKLLSDGQGFVGFDSMSGDLGYVPILKSLEDEGEGNINPEFRVALCKLYKKDVTTKLKALTEFCDLCESKESCDSATVLPYWARIYNRLSEDSDRRVREYIQNALHCLVKSVGKGIAPHLKDIMGCWWISQCDSHAPASSSASKAFKAAFPTQEKQKKALLFCHQEILHAIRINIFTTSNPVQKSVDDNTEQDKERITAASLTALASLLHNFGMDDMKKISDDVLETFYSNQRLWKFSKHKSPVVRAAFYALTSSICLNSPDHVAQYLSTICKCVLCKLDDNNPIVCRSLWEAAHSLTSTFSDWHEHVDIRKGFLPKLWLVLKSGFHGNARIICPHLLPLFSHFPPSLCVLPVYQELFRYLRLGLQADSIKKSAIETKAAITGIVECIQLILCKSVESYDSPDWESVDLILKQQLLPLLEGSIREQDFHKFLIMPLHQLTSLTLETLSAKAATESVKQNYFVKICSIMWEDILRIGKDIIDISKDGATSFNSIKIFINFLNRIKSTSMTTSNIKVKTVKVKCVKFDEPVNGDSHIAEGETDKPERVKNVFLHDSLEKAVKDIVLHVLSSDFQVSSKISLMSNFLSEFASGSLFGKIMSEEANRNDPACSFVRKHILTILPNEEKLGNVTADMAILLHSCLQQCDEVVPLLETIYHEPTHGCVEMLVLLAQHLVKDTNVSNSHCNMLLNNNEWFIEFLLFLIKDLEMETECSEFADNKWNLLFSSLTTVIEIPESSEKASTVPLIQPKSALGVLKSLNNAMLGENLSEIKIVEVNRINFSSVSNYVQYPSFTGSVEYILCDSFIAMLRLCCNEPSEEVFVAIKDTLAILLKTTYESDSSQVKLLADTISKKCAAFLLEEMLNDHSDKQCLDTITKIIALFSEEFVFHHSPQHFTMEWLDYLLPSERQLAHFRPLLDSTVWDNPQYGNTSVKLENNVLHSRYVDLVTTLASVLKELCNILSETYSNVWHQPKFQIVFMEILIMKSIDGLASENIDLNEFEGHFSSKLLSVLVRNSASIGHGWTLCLSRFVEVRFTDSDSDMFMDVIQLEGSDWSESLADTLKIFVKLSRVSSHLNSVLGWALPILLSNDINCEEDITGEGRLVFALSIATPALKYLYKFHYRDFQNNSVLLQIADKILEWKSSYGSLFLFDCDFSTVSAKQLNFNIAIVDFLVCLINCNSASVTTELWDFVQCSLVSWFESSCMTFEHQHFNFYHLTLLHNLCNLMSCLDIFMTSNATLNDPTVSHSLTTEWWEFFKPAAHSSLVPVFINIVKSKDNQASKIIPLLYCCMIQTPSSVLLPCGARLQTYLTPDSTLPPDAQTALHHLCSCMAPGAGITSSQTQIAAYSLILKLLREIYEQKDTEISNKPPQSLIYLLSEVSGPVEKAYGSLENNLAKQKLKKKPQYSSDDDDSDTSEESDVIEDEMDIILHTPHVLCYFLIWKLLIKVIHFLPSEKRLDYIANLSTDSLTSVTSKLLPKLAQIMPKIPSIQTSTRQMHKKELFNLSDVTESLDVIETKPPLKDTISMFECDVNVCFYDEPERILEEINDFQKVQHIACSLYKEVLCNLPVLTRSWFSLLNKVERADIDEFTAKYVSPYICQDELNSVNRSNTPSGLQVKARPATREVLAVYEVADAGFEISIQLPPNHPLTPSQVNTVKRAGVAAGQWRYWILQMTMLLQHQNGSILDALLLWKQKVDKRMDGLEECMICFSIVHGSNMQSLPKLQCKTCHKKYHAECLYKWFDTSNQSTCPLCRSPMMFR